MANKFELASAIFDEERKRITRNPQEWMNFLSSVCFNYKLRFDEQIMLHAQKPNAVAVLDFDRWNTRFNRRIRRGATGIVVFRKFDGTSNAINHYFDISDTVEQPNSRPVPLWEYKKEYESDIIETLESTFGDLKNKSNLADAVMSAAENAADDNIEDYFEQLVYQKENSFLEELSADEIAPIFRLTVQNSIAFMMLSRLGYNAEEYFDFEDLSGIVNFNTIETLFPFGMAVKDSVEYGLSEIAKTVFSLEKENRTFAQKTKPAYTESEIKIEGGFENGSNQLHNDKRYQGTEHHSADKSEFDFRDVFASESRLPDGAPVSDIFQSDGTGQATQSLGGDTEESKGSGRNADDQNGSTGRNNGAVESKQSDALGTKDEQPEAESAGDRSERNSLHQVNDELPAFTDEDKILYMLQNPNDDLTHRKEFLVERWNELRNIDEKGRYISTVYGGLLKQFDIDGVTVGYHYEPEGLYLYEGTFKSRTKESLFSWNLVAEIIDQLIREGNYYKKPVLKEKVFVINPDSVADLTDHENEQKEPTPVETKVEEPPAQIGFFDFIDNAIPTEQTVNEPEQVSLFADFGISQQIIDETLCIGANDTNSTLDIVMFFRRDRGLEYNAKFLKSHYGTNGAGFFFDGEQIAVWYDENGINIAKGNTAQKSSATHLTWEQAAKRIRELLELGRYLPQYQLDKVDDHEISVVSDRIVIFYRDMDENSKERCFPALTKALDGVYSYPDEVKVVKNLLSNPETFDDLNNGYIEFMDDLKRGNVQGIYKYAFKYSPEYIYEIVQGMSLEKVPFKAQSGFNPDRKYFITNDEINKLLRKGSSVQYGKYRIYTYFVNHPDLQDRMKMLKDEYGIGGGGDGFSHENHDGKGIFFSHGNAMEPYAKVLLKWNDIAKRIDSMIKANAYYYPEEIEKLPEIEKDMIARVVVAFFELASRELAMPFSEDTEPYNREDVVKAQLDNPQSLEDIDRMMSDALALMDKSNERTYTWYQKQYDNFVAFKNGEYHPYAVPEQKAPLPRPSKFSKPAEKENEQDKELDAVYDLLSACKIDDMTVDFENGEIVARDSDSEWRGAELYEFLLNEVLTFGADGKLVEGLSVDERILNNVLDYAKKYGVEPERVRNNTPSFVSEYNKLQAQYPDVILFTRLGDFYEVMGENAKVAANELDLVLTGRTINTQTGERTPMCGVPIHTVDSYISRLVAKGYKVAIAENQDVNRVVAPGKMQMDNALDRAKELINDYRQREFGYDDSADFSDISNVSLAHTETGDGNHTIDVSADLENFRIVQYLDGVQVADRTYDSLEKLISNELESLSFDDLVFLYDEEEFIEKVNAEKAKEKTEVAEPDHSEMIGDEIVMDGSHFIIEEVNGGYVSMRDVTFAENAGFPIFRRERIEDMFPLLPEKEEAVRDDNEPPSILPKAKTMGFDLHPEIPLETRHDYNFAEKEIETVGKKERFRRNVAAINVLKKCEFDGRFATPEEQVILSQYVGWGGIPEAFDESNAAWEDEYKELIVTLSPDEYGAARESTLTAFYTPQPVIAAIYKALGNMGFTQGNILEPSCGIGNFIGMLPDNMKGSKMYGVEIDSISAQIAQQLYQTSSVVAQPFEKAELPDSFFDVVVGNVPFGDFKLSDRRYDKHNFLIHDYFFAKSLDKLRPNGIMCLVTSSGTMDKANSNVRRYIAQRAELLGAIRLPNNTFKGNAGTEVVSDILFLQKRESVTDIEPSWLHLDIDENGIQMNSYFAEHPEMILGEMVMESGRFGMKSTCKPFDDIPLDTLLEEAISNIKGEIKEYTIDETFDDELNTIPADPDVKNYSFTIIDGKVYYRTNSVMTEVKTTATGEQRLKGMIAIRDSVRRLIELQTLDYPDSDIEAEQASLNALYDNYTKKYGLLNSRGNSAAFSDDNSYPLLCSLEVIKDGELERKADMFTKRTIRAHTPKTHADTSVEAYGISIGEKATVDMEYMCSLTGKSEEDIYNDLKGVIYLNPEYPQKSSNKYLPADEYLSGNVREKLAAAKEFAETDAAYQINVEALEKMQPEELTASDIDVRLGSTWVPKDVYLEFMFHLFETPLIPRRYMKIHYSEATGEWFVENKGMDKHNVTATTNYGTRRRNGYRLFESCLNLKSVRVFDKVEDENGKEKNVLNKKETALAQSKQELISQAFKDWIYRDPKRRERLCKIYNERFNSIRPREYDGSHITFEGMNPAITLNPHQVNAAARGIYGGNTLLAHCVGAGKTFTMAAIAQESKRLGLCNKSLFVVPNHLIKQWAAEYLTLYPSANLLVATKKDFQKQNRRKFCSRISTGDYDAVIIGHSQFEKIPVSIGRQAFTLQQEIDQIVNGIADLKAEKSEKFTIKQLEATKKRLEAKLDRLNNQSNKDDVVTFEELGIDRIFVDEAHYYKNLFIYSKMRNVGGISQTEAQKSSDLYMKCRYLDELTENKGVCFATGTPISNSMVEMFTMQRYLQYALLEKQGLVHFDSWAATFGETVTAMELAPEGTGYQIKTRFARFYNLPELMSMFKECADIQTADMLDLPVPKANFHNIAVKPSPIQKEMVASLAERAESIRAGGIEPHVDNMLKVTNDGRKLALEQRLINPMLPDFEGSKVNACVNNVYEIWKEYADKRSAQLVFCDLSTPKGTSLSDEEQQEAEQMFTDVYTDIRRKLISKGIPADEIAFIHDAKTDVQKAELFDKVRKGDVRVLLGSTTKMGAGTNVQHKLKAQHDIDCPWRPSDLEQRLGRTVRQLNENDEVEIFRYVTEETFDAYLYQLVESKQKFISQIMTSKTPVRSADDIDSAALSYAEIKMLATGNPLIKERMELDMQVQKLNMLKSHYLSERYSLEDKVNIQLPLEIKKCTAIIDGLKKDVKTAREHPKTVGDNFAGITIAGTHYTEKEAAGKEILALMKSFKSTDQTIPVGEYRGFILEMYISKGFGSKYMMGVKGSITHSTELGTNEIGNITRLDNLMERFDTDLRVEETRLTELTEQLEIAKDSLKEPFKYEDELAQKQARLTELNKELELDKTENVMDFDDEPDESEVDRAKKERVQIR